METLYFCEWCRRMGLPSIYNGLVNGERIISICTECANANISNLKVVNVESGPYNRVVKFWETGIEREERERANG